MALHRELSVERSTSGSAILVQHYITQALVVKAVLRVGTASSTHTLHVKAHQDFSIARSEAGTLINHFPSLPGTLRFYLLHLELALC